MGNSLELFKCTANTRGIWCVGTILLDPRPASRVVLGHPIVCVPDSLHRYHLVTLSTLTFPKADSEAPKCQFLNQATFQR